MRERLAKLSGGIAVMSVGAATETEMNEIRSRIQDALRATRSAASQGLLAGGGVDIGHLGGFLLLATLKLAKELLHFGFGLIGGHFGGLAIEYGANGVGKVLYVQFIDS